MRLFHLLGVFLFLVTAKAAEETAVVAEGKINVRGKPSFVGEVITQLEQGEKVTVLERITTSAAKPGESTNWAKIKLPPNTPVWVFAPFIQDGVVSVSRLNVRAGRGENYSVIGRLNRGDAVKVIRPVEEWAEIEAPTNAYAFVDLDLLQFDGAPKTAPAAASAPTVASQTETKAGVATTPLATVPPSAAQPSVSPDVTQSKARPAIDSDPSLQTETKVRPALPQTDTKVRAGTDATAAATTTPAPATPTVTETVKAPEAATSAPAVAAVTTPATPTATETVPQPTTETKTVQPTVPATSATETPATVSVPAPATSPTTSPLPAREDLPKVAPPIAKRNDPPPKRVVRREGVVRATSSIQAPTWYELEHAETKKRINYLFSDSMELNLKDYRGQKVVVTGEEAIDPRWPNTPILDMQTLDVLPNDAK